MLPLNINEFLCFLTVQFDKIERDRLISILIETYGFRATLEAKNILISECEQVTIIDSIKDFCAKRQEGKSGALRRVVTDAVDIWTVVDREKAGKLLVKFVAANPNLLPNADVSNFNLQFLVTSILKLQEKAESQDAALIAITEQLNNNNKNNNKRKLSGLAAPFEPKRHQTEFSSSATLAATKTGAALFLSMPSSTSSSTDTFSFTEDKSESSAASFATPVVMNTTPAETTTAPAETTNAPAVAITAPAAPVTTPVTTLVTTPATPVTTHTAPDTTLAATRATPATTGATPAATGAIPAATGATPAATGETPAVTGAAAGSLPAAAPSVPKTSSSNTTKLLQSNKNNWIVKERKSLSSALFWPPFLHPLSKKLVVGPKFKGKKISFQIPHIF